MNVSGLPTPGYAKPAFLLWLHWTISHEQTLDRKETIALAWTIDLKTNSFAHAGQRGAYESITIFNLTRVWAVIALYNRAGAFPRFVDSLGENVSQLLLGPPSVHLDYLPEAEKNALAHLSDQGSD